MSNQNSNLSGNQELLDCLQPWLTGEYQATLQDFIQKISALKSELDVVHGVTLRLHNEMARRYDRIQDLESQVEMYRMLYLSATSESQETEIIDLTDE